MSNRNEINLIKQLVALVENLRSFLSLSEQDNVDLEDFIEYLDLSYLDNIYPDMVKELNKFTGFSINLCGLVGISVEVAKEIIKLKVSKIYVSSVSCASDAAYKELVKHDGIIFKG